jgi:outer membrane biosynthesis protein TonB
MVPELSTRFTAAVISVLATAVLGVGVFLVLDAGREVEVADRPATIVDQPAIAPVTTSPSATPTPTVSASATPTEETTEEPTSEAPVAEPEPSEEPVRQEAEPKPKPSKSSSKPAPVDVPAFPEGPSEPVTEDPVDPAGDGTSEP